MTTEERIQKDAEQFDDGQPVYEFPANNAAYWRGVKHGFKQGATKYYSLALEETAARNKEIAIELQKEIERLKGLIEKAFSEGEKYNENKKKPSFTGFLDGYTGIYGFKKFAKENNL